MRKLHVLLTLLSILMLVSSVTANLIPSDEKIYMKNGYFLWKWQIEYKTNEIINDSRLKSVKQFVINKIGFDDFYNSTYIVIKNMFKKTGYLNRLPNTIYGCIIGCIIIKVIKGGML